VCGITDGVDLAASLVPVLPQDTVANLDPSGPVLRVDDKESSWSDQDVIDIRLRSAGPGAVIESQVAICGQLFESLRYRRLTHSTSGELGSALFPILGALTRLLRLS
jgi:hypothetical protein